MTIEAPKPAPKGALRRLGQRLEQILIPPLLSDEELEIIERSRQGLEDSNLGFNPLDIVTIIIKNMINFNYYDKNDKTDEASIPTEKVTTQTALGKLKDTMKEINNNPHF